MLKKPAGSFWKMAVFYTLLQRVSLFLFGVIAYMLLVRGFSTQTNGVWALYITLFSLFESSKQGLLRNATIKFLGMSKYREKKDETQSSSLLLNGLFSLAVIVLIFVGGQALANWFKAPDLFAVLCWSSIIILLLIPYNHCEIILQATLRFESLFRSAFLRQGIFFGGLSVLYFFYREHFTLLNVLLIQAVALLAGVLVILGQSRAVMFQSFRLDRRITRELLHFGKFTFGTNLFSGVSRNFDHFLTANLLPATSGKNFVAYYHTVARINNLVDIPALAASDVLFPKSVETMEKEGVTKVKFYFEQVAGTLLAFMVPVSLVIFLLPQVVVAIIAGPEYYPAVQILQLTIFFSMVRPLSYQFGSTLDAIGKPRVNFIFNGALMIVSFLLTYFLINVYDGMGAAYATMIVYSMSLIAMIIIMKHYVRVELRNILSCMLERYREIFRFYKKR